MTDLDREWRRSLPWLCRMGFHRWGRSYRDSDPTIPRWRTDCERCGTLLCYSLERFR